MDWTTPSIWIACWDSRLHFHELLSELGERNQTEIPETPEKYSLDVLELPAKPKICVRIFGVNLLLLFTPNLWFFHYKMNNEMTVEKHGFLKSVYCKCYA